LQNDGHIDFYVLVNICYLLSFICYYHFISYSLCALLTSDTEQQLPTDKIHALCGMSAVQQYVRQTDYIFYQTIVGILVPDVLRPIPSQLLLL